MISRYVGGGFGGKTEADQGVEAARLARIAGKPVQVVYSRAEEFSTDRFRPAAVMKIRTGLAGDKIVLWDGQVVGAGEREADPFYDIPHKRVTSAGGWQGGNPPGMHPFQRGRVARVHRRTAIPSRANRTWMCWRPKLAVDPLEFRLNQSEPCPHEARAGDRRQAVWMAGGARVYRARRRDGVRHVFQRLQRHNGRTWQ